MLRLADGSVIKLGDNATLQIQDLAVVRDAGRLLRGALKVLEGAFRLTTAALQQDRDKPDMAQFDAQADALALYDSLRRDGYAARILPRAADGGHRYFVRLYGFASQAEASALGDRLKQAYPSQNPAATRQ